MNTVWTYVMTPLGSTSLAMLVKPTMSMKRIVTPSWLRASWPMRSGTAAWCVLKYSITWRGKMPAIMPSCGRCVGQSGRCVVGNPS